MKLIKETYASWGAEVVFITSNYQGNKEMMEGCKEAGIPAFVSVLCHISHVPAMSLIVLPGHPVGFLSLLGGLDVSVFGLLSRCLGELQPANYIIRTRLQITPLCPRISLFVLHNLPAISHIFFILFTHHSDRSVRKLVPWHLLILDLLPSNYVVSFFCALVLHSITVAG